MKIFIDGEPFNPSSQVILRSKRRLISEIDEEISRKGLTYTNITVDGVEMDSSAFVRLRKGREAHFKTCEIKTLVIESLQEAKNYLPRLNAGIQNIASGLERKEQEDISEHLASFAEGLDWLVSVMQKSQFLLKVKDSELVEKEGTITKLNKSLESISECFEKGRIMEIAFHMRQGVLPEIKVISNYIAKLLETANHMNIESVNE
ncbi:MAG: hypothetical protein FWE49_04200 [Synergistaceae bacterium]|nr:hypothetical protein [Synergistaceae bacterium]